MKKTKLKETRSLKGAIPMTTNIEGLTEYLKGCSREELMTGLAGVLKGHSKEELERDVLAILTQSKLILNRDSLAFAASVRGII